MNDQKEFEETLEAMKAVTMKGKEIEATLKLVALVVHLLNVSFKPLNIKVGMIEEEDDGGLSGGFCSMTTMDLLLRRC